MTDNQVQNIIRPFGRITIAKYLGRYKSYFVYTELKIAVAFTRKKLNMFKHVYQVNQRNQKLYQSEHIDNNIISHIINSNNKN